MKYYTIEKVADFLKMTKEQVFDLITWKPCEAGGEKPILFPSAEFTAPIEIQRIKSKWKLVHRRMLSPQNKFKIDFDASMNEEIIGCYDVRGYNSGSLLKWDEYGYACVSQVDAAPVINPLSIPKNTFSIHKDQLRISAVSLGLFMEMKGIPVPEEIQKGTEEKAEAEPPKKQYPKKPGGTPGMRTPPTLVKSRNDELKKILLHVIADLWRDIKRRPNWNEVYNHLKKLAKDDKHKVIQEVKHNKIYWRRANGKEEITNSSALQKRLSSINKSQNTLPAND